MPIDRQPLRVGFDATALLGDRTGIGVFAHELLARLAPHPALDVTTFAVTWRGRRQLVGLVPPSATVADRPLAARPLRALWTRTDRPSLRAWIGPQDVVHGPNFVVPPGGRAAEVATVHDLTAVHHPELCTADTLQYPALITRALARGAWIHTPSAFVAAEVRAAFDVPGARVVAVPNGVSPPPPPTPRTDAAAGRRLVGADRYVLALGTIEPRKDHVGLVRAFDQLAATDVDVVLAIAGADGWGTEAVDAAIDQARHRARIRRIGRVSDEARAALLRGAAVLAYPSIYEGFGLPPLEAMAVGVPVVTSDAGAIPEVVGDAARVVANGARDAHAFAAALATVLDDAEERDRLVAAGHARVAAFTWDATATGIIELYRRAVAARAA